MIYYGMSKNHISVRPKILSNHLIILDIKIVFHYKFALKKLLVNISDWLMLYIEYNFYRWLADVGPTLARRSKSRWPNVGSQRRTDGCADVGPTSVRRRNAIWAVVPIFVNM